MDTIIIGEKAPRFTLPDLLGVFHSLDEYLGKIAILNFWSAECDWCSRIDQEFISYGDKWKDLVEVIWIASNMNEPQELIKKTAAERKLLPVLLDVNQIVADLYGAQTTPHFFVVDATGILRYSGAWDDVTFRQRNPNQVYIPRVIEALLQNQIPDIIQTPPYGCIIVR